MSRPSGGNGELRAGRQRRGREKGAVLIGLAVIVGVFLLQRVDTSNAGSPVAATSRPPRTTTTVKPRSSTTTTTLPAAPLKTPDQLKVLVLNGGAKSGAAATMRTRLEQEGYTNEPQANTWTGHSQTGNSLMCKAGLDREKVALLQQAALQGAKVVAFASPAPPFSGDVDCVVVVGA